MHQCTLGAFRTLKKTPEKRVNRHPFVPRGAAMRSTPLAMLAGEGRLRVAPRPTGCLRRGLTPPLCGAFWRCRGEGRPANQPASGGPNKGRPERGERRLDMVGALYRQL
jgi:hypothetical protein